MPLKSSFGVATASEPFHTGGPLAISSDGALLVGTVGESLHVLCGNTARRLAELPGDSEDITAAAVRPDARYLAACSRSGMIRIFTLHPDDPAGQYVLLRAFKSSHEAPVLVADVDPTSTLLATGSADSTIRVWDINQGFYCTHHLRGHSGLVSCVKFDTRRSAGRVWLASGSEDGSVRVWDLKGLGSSGKQYSKFVLKGHTSVVRGIDFSNDGRKMVSVGRDRVINVWSLENGSLVRTIPVFETLESTGVLRVDHVKALGLPSDRLICFTGGEKGLIRLWDAETGEQISEQPPDLNASYAINDIIYLPAKGQVAAVTSDQNVIFHALPSLVRTKLLAGYHDEILDVAFLPCATDPAADESHLIVATNSEQPRLVDLTTGASTLMYAHKAIVLAIDRTPDGAIIVSGSKDNTARVWTMDRASKDLVKCVATCVGHTEAVGAVAVSRGADSSSHHFMLTGSQDRTVKFWDLASINHSSDPDFRIKSKYTVQAHEKDINAVTVAPNDRIFATASQDRTAKVWSVEDGKLLGTCTGHKRGVWCARFSPVDQVLATCSSDKTVKIWSLGDFTCLKTFEGHSNSVLRIEFISLGMQIVSSGSDGLVKIWTIKTEECIASLDNHADKIWALAIDRSERRLASGGADSVITIWEDRTELVEQEAREARNSQIRIEQELANRLAVNDFCGAVRLALQLKQPFRLLDLFKKLFEQAVDEQDPIELTKHRASASGSFTVDGIIVDLSLTTDIPVLLQYIRDWNTDGRHATAAQRVLRVILGKCDLAKLETMPGIKAMLEGLLPYTQRHYDRTDDLLTELYLVEYTLKAMNVLSQPK